MTQPPDGRQIFSENLYSAGDLQIELSIQNHSVFNSPLHSLVSFLHIMFETIPKSYIKNSFLLVKDLKEMGIDNNYKLIIECSFSLY